MCWKKWLKVFSLIFKRFLKWREKVKALTWTFWWILANFSTFEKDLKYQCKPLQSVFKRIWSVFKWFCPKCAQSALCLLRFVMILVKHFILRHVIPYAFLARNFAFQVAYTSSLVDLNDCAIMYILILLEACSHAARIWIHCMCNWKYWVVIGGHFPSLSWLVKHLMLRSLYDTVMTCYSCRLTQITKEMMRNESSKRMKC
jgi:hypothetical protein